MSILSACSHNSHTIYLMLISLQLWAFHDFQTFTKYYNLNVDFLLKSSKKYHIAWLIFWQKHKKKPNFILLNYCTARDTPNCAEKWRNGAEDIFMGRTFV